MNTSSILGSPYAQLGQIVLGGLVEAIVVVEPDMPGLEFRSSVNRLHYVTADNQLHYRSAIGRAHFVSDEEDN